VKLRRSQYQEQVPQEEEIEEPARLVKAEPESRKPMNGKRSKELVNHVIIGGRIGRYLKTERELKKLPQRMPTRRKRSETQGREQISDEVGHNRTQRNGRKGRGRPFQLTSDYKTCQLTSPANHRDEGRTLHEQISKSAQWLKDRR
jgi:hypothetical protein